MKTITLSADERLIERAEARARKEHTTLDEQFQQWLAQYAGRSVDSHERVEQAMEVVDRIRSYTGTDGRRFTRDELNER